MCLHRAVCDVPTLITRTTLRKGPEGGLSNARVQQSDLPTSATAPEVVPPPRAGIGVDPRPEIHRRFVDRILFNHDARSGYHDWPTDNYGFLHDWSFNRARSHSNTRFHRTILAFVGVRLSLIRCALIAIGWKAVRIAWRSKGSDRCRRDAHHEVAH